VIKIGVSDWIVARSDNFKVLMAKLRDHQITTQSSFRKVKQKHRTVDAKMNDQEKRIKSLEKLLKAVQAVPVIRVIKKRKRR